MFAKRAKALEKWIAKQKPGTIGKISTLDCYEEEILDAIHWFQARGFEIVREGDLLKVKFDEENHNG